jgi:hypothetical protein
MSEMRIKPSFEGMAHQKPHLAALIMDMMRSKGDDPQFIKAVEQMMQGDRAGSDRTMEKYFQDEKRSSGQTLVMFHGTSRTAAAAIERNGFRVSSDGMLGRGVYLSKDFKKAQHYGAVVLKVSVNVGRVKRIDRQGHHMQKTWAANGYDTAWVPPNCGMVPSGLEENCVADPTRIRVLGRARG